MKNNKKQLNFNPQTPDYHQVAKFYLTPIGNFLPWKYVEKKRLDEILEECYKHGQPQTKRLINNFYDFKD